MSDLSTSYLGLSLKNPLVCSSSPLCESLGALKQMEDAGAAAVILHSLFEEQIRRESLDLDQTLDEHADSYAESTSYFPDVGLFRIGPEAYLEHIRKAKAALGIPVIASLNGCTPGGWTEYAYLMEQAGADALELNVYMVPTSVDVTSAAIEQDHVDLVKAVKGAVSIPVSVKLSPRFTTPAAMARQLDDAGADGLVLFNRFYQPDFDLELLEVTPSLRLSHPSELLLRLHWVAILFGNVEADLAVTGGVHSGADVLKCMMAGARVACMTSALLKNGIDHLKKVQAEVVHWMEEHEYDSVSLMQGSMSLRSASDPSAVERANYLKVLRTYAMRSTSI
jgi:dihydroorotate dehydrogenase (fumarate)